MCKVSPEHIGMLRIFGTVFFVGGVVSILSGVTYFKGLIRRDEEPVSFWANTVFVIFLGGAVLLGTWVCV